MSKFMGVIAGLLLASSFPALATNTSSVKYITSCGVTISQSGEYHLKADLVCPDSVHPAITITASHVELDLDGHTLDGNGTGVTGVRVQNASDVDVDGGGGTVKSFSTGVLFTSVTNGSITNVATLKSFPTAGPAFGTGIILENCCNIQVSCNTVKGNYIQGIELIGDNKSSNTNNTIFNNTVCTNAAGIVVAGTSTSNSIIWNNVSSNISNGIQINQGAVGNCIEFNWATGNGIYDLVDLNLTASNTWFFNFFGKASGPAVH